MADRWAVARPSPKYSDRNQRERMQVAAMRSNGIYPYNGGAAPYHHPACSPPGGGAMRPAPVRSAIVQRLVDETKELTSWEKDDDKKKDEPRMAVSVGRSLGAPSYAGCSDGGLFGGALGSSMQLIVLLLALWALLSQLLQWSEVAVMRIPPQFSEVFPLTSLEKDEADGKKKPRIDAVKAPELV